jgi:hypothetical protein
MKTRAKALGLTSVLLNCLNDSVNDGKRGEGKKG